MMRSQRTRKTSSLDVAKFANVSQATVSNVLNGKHSGLVSESTVQRVLAAASELGYRPNHLARGLLKGKTSTVGVFVSYLGSRFHADIVRGVQRVCQEQGYSVLIGVSETDHVVDAGQVNFLLDHQVDAILIIGGFYQGAEQAQWLKQIARDGVHCILVDDRTNAHNLDCVVSDDFSGMRLAVEHLVAHGHRKIAYSGGQWISSTSLDRQEGFLAAITEFAGGARLDPPVLILANDNDDLRFKVAEMMGGDDPPTALVASNDHALQFVIEGAESVGKRVPDDLAVIGYGNQEISWLFDLSTIDQHPLNLGEAAARRLLYCLAEEVHDSTTIRMPVSLIARRSTENYVNAL